jgi:hypothetical protein
MQKADGQSSTSHTGNEAARSLKLCSLFYSNDDNQKRLPKYGKGGIFFMRSDVRIEHLFGEKDEKQS